MQHTRDLKLKAEQTVQDTIVATRIIEGFRNPQQHGQYLKTYANFPLEFFNRVTEQMRERLRWYKTTIEVRYAHRDRPRWSSRPRASTSNANYPLRRPSHNIHRKVCHGQPSTLLGCETHMAIL